MKKYFLALVLVFGLVSVANANEIDKCFNYLESQNYQLALQAGQNAVRIYPRSADAHRCLGEAYYNLGYSNLSINELKRAEELIKYEEAALLYYYRQLGIYRDLNNKEGESVALNDIGLIYEEQGKYDKALEYYNKSLQLTTKPSSIATTYNNIAIVYSDKGDNNKAVEYYKKAIELGQEAGDYHNTAKYMINLGGAYTNLKNFQEAQYYLQQGLSMIQKLGDKYVEAAAYVGFGKLYLAQNQESLAKEYFTKAYNLLKVIVNNNKAQEVYENYLKQ